MGRVRRVLDRAETASAVHDWITTGCALRCRWQAIINADL